MKRMARVWSVFDGIEKLLAVLAGVILAFIMLLISFEVVLRYVFGNSIRWAFEVTEYSMVFVTFLPAAWVLKREGHVVIDLADNWLRPRQKAMLVAITSVVGALICLVITWYGTVVTAGFFRQGARQASAMEPPSFILYTVIPLGGLLLFVEFLRRAHKHLGNWRRPSK